MIEVVSTLDGLAALRPEWNALAATANTPLTSHGWVYACAEAFGPDERLAVFLVRDRGGLRALAPLMIEDSGRGARLVSLSHRTGEPEQFLYSDQQALVRLCKMVAKSGLPLSLTRLDSSAPELRSFEAIPRTDAVSIARRGSTQTAHVPLGPAWDKFEAALPSSKLAWLQRKRRKLDRAGRVSFVPIVPDPDSLDGLLAELFRIEAAGWKGRAGTAILKDPWMLRFITAYARNAAADGTLRLFFLKVDEVNIAAQMHVVHASRLWQLKIGYDEQWSKCSPGVLLTHEILRYGCEVSLEGCEFLGVTEEWQRRWPVEIRQQSSIRVYPISFRGGLALAGDAANLLGRRLLTGWRSSHASQAAGHASLSPN